MDSPVRPAYLTRIQRIRLFQVKESIAPNVALDTPYRKQFAHPASDLFKLMISSSRSMWRVDLYVLAFTLPLIDAMAFLDGVV